MIPSLLQRSRTTRSPEIIDSAFDSRHDPAGRIRDRYALAGAVVGSRAYSWSSRTNGPHNDHIKVSM